MPGCDNLHQEQGPSTAPEDSGNYIRYGVAYQMKAMATDEAAGKLYKHGGLSPRIILCA